MPFAKALDSWEILRQHPMDPRVLSRKSSLDPAKPNLKLERSAKNLSDKTFILLNKCCRTVISVGTLKLEGALTVMEPSMRRLLVADSQGFYRSGLRTAVEGAIPFLEVNEAQSYGVMVALLDRSAFDLVLVDSQLAGVTSLDKLKYLRVLYPYIRFALLSDVGRQHDVFKVLAAGFNGFIFKSQDEREIIGAISDILSGRIYTPPLEDGYSGSSPSGYATGAAWSGLQVSGQGSTPRGLQEIVRLTARQREVLALIAEGLPNKEIARRLNISEATTKIHAGALMRALGVKNRTEAALLVQGLRVKLKGGEAAF